MYIDRSSSIWRFRSHLESIQDRLQMQSRIVMVLQAIFYQLSDENALLLLPFGNYRLLESTRQRCRLNCFVTTPLHTKYVTNNYEGSRYALIILFSIVKSGWYFIQFGLVVTISLLVPWYHKIFNW